MTDENKAAVEKAPKPERVKKNGQTRPADGTLTGHVWDLADKITAEQGRVAKRDEVMAAYKASVADPAEATVATQYGRWVQFNGYSEQVKALRKAEKDIKLATGENDKAEKAAEKARLAAEKEAEKAAKKAKREAEAAAKKAEKEAKAAAKKAAKEKPAEPTPTAPVVEAAQQSDVDIADEEGEDDGEE